MQAARSAPWLLLAFVGACAQGGPAPVEPKTQVAPAKDAPAAPSPCELSRGARARVGVLLTEGRLHRTVGVIRRADELCPAESASSGGVLAETLAELGRWTEAAAAASGVEARPDAKDDARAAAKRARDRIAAFSKPTAPTDESRKLLADGMAAFERGEARVAKDKLLSSWVLHHPSGDALTTAGLASLRLGEAGEARRLLDRAAVELAVAYGGPMELDVPNGFEGYAQSIVWTHAGRTLVVAHRNVTSIVDATSLHEKVRFRGHTLPVTSVAVSHDGRVVVTGSRDETVRLWDATTGRELQRLEGHKDAIGGVAIDREGKRVASVSANGAVRIWSVATGEAIGAPTGCTGALAVAFSDDGKRLAAGCQATAGGSAAMVWDAATGKQLVAIGGHAGAVRRVAFASKGNVLATAGADHLVRTWDLGANKELRRFEGHAATITDLAFSPDGKTLASSSADATAMLFSVTGGSPPRVLDGHAMTATSVAWSPDGKRLATGSYNKLHLWDAATAKETYRLEGHAQPLHAVALSQDGKWLATGSADKSVRLWSAARATPARKLEGHGAPVTGLAFSPDAHTLASSGLDATIRLWDVTLGTERFRLDAGVGLVQGIVYAPSGTTLASVSADKALQLWDLSTRKERKPLEAPPSQGLAFGPDGTRIAAGSGSAVVLRSHDGHELMRLVGHTALVNAVVFSPDGDTIASGSSDGTVRLWSTQTGKEVARLSGHEGAVLAVAFRPVGNVGLVITGGADATLRTWDPKTGREILKLVGHIDPVVAIDVSEDGRVLASASRDGTTNLWSLPDGQLRISLRSLSGRDAAYAIAPTGHLEAFGEVRDLAICRVGAVTVAMELCDERFTSPGMVSDVLHGERSYLLP